MWAKACTEGRAPTGFEFPTAAIFDPINALFQKKAKLSFVVAALLTLPENTLQGFDVILCPQAQSFLWVRLGTSLLLGNEEKIRNYVARLIVDTGVLTQINTPQTKENYSHGHLAVRSGHHAAIVALLAGGIRLDATDVQNRTPLHVCMERWYEHNTQQHTSPCNTRKDFNGMSLSVVTCVWDRLKPSLMCKNVYYLQHG